ncbi:condensin complex subunit 2 [Galendromus occidentalis]|uniref:Condensin complex subunit 2 n=1 Tax=Galendromus occidentalis TaxID=34638 RepID=A0AAJ6QX24_9ACAR|nr:condensin complex subunit 2 [Galendromus occidentalis]
MVRRKRLSLAPETLEDLQEVTADQIEHSKLERARALQEQAEKQSAQETQAATLHGEQLSVYIQNCVKLAQDNKITIRNAFDLQLIDYMIAFAKKADAGNDGTNFSLASMSLDASGKIYGYRVDAVHQDVVRLISGIGGGKNGQAPDIPEAPENILGEDADSTKKVRKRRIRSTYIGEDGANEGHIEIDHEICGNETLTTVHHNDGNALGRILSYNLIPLECGSVDLEGSSSWWSQEHLKKVEAEKEIVVTEDLPLLHRLLDLDMNATLAMNVSQAEADPLSQGSDDHNSSVIFDPDAEPMPIAEDCGGDAVVGDVHLDELSAIHPLGAPNDSQFSIAGDFSMIYQDKFKSSGLNFAGPSQFRLKRFNILGSEKKAAGQTRLKTLKRDLKYMSFKDEEMQECFEDVTATSSKKKTNVLISMTMDRWSSETTTLTVEFTPSSFTRLAQLFTLPSISVRQSKQKATGDLGDERLIEYHDDADDRPVSPCADDLFSELGRDAEHAERDFNLDNIEAVENDFGVPPSQPLDEAGYDNLISAPGIIAEKLAIAYTKAAKKFNVRQMKESYWKVLTKETNTETMKGEKPFSELYHEVVQYLSATNRKNISVPLAFVSALMLCNEKHLVLKPGVNDTEFTISQAPDPYTTSKDLHIDGFN